MLIYEAGVQKRQRRWTLIADQRRRVYRFSAGFQCCLGCKGPRESISGFEWRCKKLKGPSSDKFLAIYNELDNYMRRKLKAKDGVPHTFLLEKMAARDRIFSNNYLDLREFAQLRNAIVHNPDKFHADPIAEPHSYVVKKYEEIKNSVLDPPAALTAIATPAENMFTTTLEANALQVMQEMNENFFSHVPVVDKDKKLIGVFSENTVFCYLVKNQALALGENVSIGEFAEFIPIDKHDSEYFGFVPRNALVIDIEEMFQADLYINKRLAIIFITETGSPRERILGLITAWDLAGYEG
jgi:CBS domain-containing protein